MIVGAGLSPALTIVFFWQLLAGRSFGILIGLLGVFIFDKIRNIDIGYYYVFLIGINFLGYSFADLLKASGMLSVFFAGYIMGNEKLPN